MQRLRDTSAEYGLVSITLHWAAALGVIALLGSAISIWLAPTESAADTRLRLHVAIGALFWLVIAARVLWRAIERAPQSIVRNPTERAVSRAVHVLLLILLTSQLITGPLDIWSGGWAIAVLPGFEIPPPFAPWPDAAHEAIGQVHRWTGVTLLILATAHIGAAAKHFFIDRDGVAERMLRTRRQEPNS